MKKSLVLILAMLILSATACGGNTPSESTKSNGETDVQTESVTETEAVDPVVKRDFDGYTFRFLNSNTSYEHNALVIEEETADIIDNAFYLRNMRVGERFNITFAETITKSPQADYTASSIAGDQSFDIATLRMEWAFPIVVENQALPWTQIPNIDLTQDYWVQNSLSAFSLMHNVYFAVSAFDITHYDSVRTFAFNKRLIDQYQLESPYALVSAGKWTLDTYMEQGMAIANDVDGDGKWTSADMYSTDSNSNVYVNTLMAGIGSILSIQKDKDDMPYFNLEEEYYLDRMAKVSDMMKERQNGLIATNAFASGHALFYNNLICTLSGLREMEDEFGIIPAPKYDEEQAEYINLGGSPFFMVIPVFSDDLDRTGAIMEGLAVDSVGLIDVAYYDKLLKGKTSRDEESSGMLDLIFSTLEYYHPLANSYLNAPLADNYIWNSSDQIVSYLQSVKGKIESEIDTALDTYKTNMGIASAQ